LVTGCCGSVCSASCGGFMALDESGDLTTISGCSVYNCISNGESSSGASFGLLGGVTRAPSSANFSSCVSGGHATSVYLEGSDGVDTGVSSFCVSMLCEGHSVLRYGRLIIFDHWICVENKLSTFTLSWQDSASTNATFAGCYFKSNTFDHFVGNTGFCSFVNCVSNVPYEVSGVSATISACHTGFSFPLSICSYQRTNSLQSTGCSAYYICPTETMTIHPECFEYVNESVGSNDNRRGH
jgi:hypothetical protein